MELPLRLPVEAVVADKKTPAPRPGNQEFCAVGKPIRIVPSGITSRNGLFAAFPLSTFSVDNPIGFLEFPLLG